MDAWILMLANICITVGYVGMQLCKSIWLFGKKLKDPAYKEQRLRMKSEKNQMKFNAYISKAEQSALKIKSKSDVN